MEAPPKRRFFPWLFRWKFWRVISLIVAGMVTLLALFYAEENWRGKRAWESYKREMEAKGEVFDFTKFVPPRVPDDQNFAMTPFLAPLFDFIPGTQRPRDSNAWQRIDPVTDLPNEARKILNNPEWKEGKALDLVSLANDLLATNRHTPAQFSHGQAQEAARAILENLKVVEPVLNELRSAGQRPYSRFNIAYDWESKFAIVLPEVGTVSAICSKLELRSCSELALNQTDAAFQDVSLMFRLVWSIQTEPFLISQLVRAACLGRTMQPIWEGLSRHQWSESQLEYFAQQLGTLNFMDDGMRSIRAEQSFHDPFFAQLRESRNPIGELNKILANGDGLDSPSEMLCMVMPSGWFYFEEMTYHRLFNYETDSVLKSNEVDPEVVDQKSQHVTQELGGASSAFRHHKLIAALLLPSINGFEFKIARAQTCANLAAIACALERYRLANGQYPETLDALSPKYLAAVPHDVIMNQQMKYRRSDDGQFILYSVGWNKKDDGGVAVKETRERTDGDWVWRYPSSSKRDK
jgi:hypothetical protein